MQNKLTASVAAVLLTALVGSTAFAQQTPAQNTSNIPDEAAVEAAALEGVTISLADAIASVEAMNTGKVVEAMLLTEGSTSVYQITTLQPDGTETNYAVDVKTGAAVATVDQSQDEGDDNDGGLEGEEGQHDGHHEGPNGDGDGETQDDASN